MAYRRRKATVRIGRYAKTVTRRAKGPKHYHRRTATGIFGSVFNLHWLFGNGRYLRRR